MCTEQRETKQEGQLEFHLLVNIGVRGSALLSTKKPIEILLRNMCNLNHLQHRWTFEEEQDKKDKPRKRIGKNKVKD